MIAVEAPALLIVGFVLSLWLVVLLLFLVAVVAGDVAVVAVVAGDVAVVFVELLVV